MLIAQTRQGFAANDGGPHRPWELELLRSPLKMVVSLRQDHSPQAMRSKDRDSVHALQPQARVACNTLLDEGCQTVDESCRLWT